MDSSLRSVRITLCLSVVPFSIKATGSFGSLPISISLLAISSIFEFMEFGMSSLSTSLQSSSGILARKTGGYLQSWLKGWAMKGTFPTGPQKKSIMS